MSSSATPDRSPGDDLVGSPPNATLKAISITDPEQAISTVHRAARGSAGPRCAATPTDNQLFGYAGSHAARGARQIRTYLG